jgi:hypothetical protein
MGAARRNMQAQRKMLKKCLEHQIYQSKRKFSQKSIVSSLLVKRSQKIAWKLPDGICRLNPKC